MKDFIKNIFMLTVIIDILKKYYSSTLQYILESFHTFN
jgi:hypothetical protein